MVNWIKVPNDIISEKQQNEVLVPHTDEPSDLQLRKQATGSIFMQNLYFNVERVFALVALLAWALIVSYWTWMWNAVNI